MSRKLYTQKDAQTNVDTGAGTPVNPTDVANKDYVDAAVAAVSGGGGSDGGYAGVWTATAYPAGSTVTYQGNLYGTTVATTAAQQPPGGAAVPVGQDMIASAPDIVVFDAGASGSSGTFSNTGLTSEVNEPSVVGGTTGKRRSAWWRYKPTASGTVTFTTTGSGSTGTDPVLTLFKLVGALDFANLTALANDDDGGGGTDSKITYAVVAGDTYYIQMGCYSGTIYCLNVSNGALTASAASPWALVSTTDHGKMSGLADDDHPQYVKKTGDTMSGRLTVDRPTGGTFADPSILITRNLYPAIDLIRTDAVAGVSSQWRMYISGTGTGSGALGFAQKDVNGAGTGGTIYFKDNGIIAAGADPVSNLDVATKQYVDTRRTSRNRFNNGDFAVNQRAATTVNTHFAFVADRWRLQCQPTTGGTATATLLALAPGTLPESPANCVRLVTTGSVATNDYTSLVQYIESCRTLAGKQVCLSFWAKAASGTPKLAVRYFQATGSSGSADITTDGGVSSPISTTWARYSIVTTLPALVGSTISGGNDNLRMYLYTSGGSAASGVQGIGIQNNTIDLWGMQLEEGSVPTPYDYKTYGDNLRECQRYYWRAGPGDIFPGSSMSATLAKIMVRYPVPMRGQPSVSQSGTITVAEPNVNSWSVSALQSFAHSAQFTGCSFNTTLTAGAATLGRSCQMEASAGAYLQFEIEY